MESSVKVSPQRRAIQEAALELVAGRGYHGASMSAIAQAVGLSKATLYWHFPSKEELFRSVYEEFVREMLSPLGQVLGSEDTAEVKLLRIAKEFLALARDSAAGWRVLLQLTIQPELAETVARVNIDESGQWVMALAGLFEQLGDPEPNSTARLYMAAMDGVALHVLADPDGAREEETIAAITRCFLSPRGN